MLPATNDLKVMELLVTGPMYGGEMVERGGLKRGSIYTVLERLVRKKLVMTWQGRTNQVGIRGTLRLYYSLTPHGERTLRAAKAAQKILDEDD